MNLFKKEELNEKHKKNVDDNIEKSDEFHGFSIVELKEGKSALRLLKQIYKKVKEALKQLQNPSSKCIELYPDINLKEKVGRYPKRNVQKVNYLEESIPDDDDYIFCDDCNQEWEGDCPIHGPLTIIPDEKVSGNGHKGTNLAMLTLPSQFEIAPSKISSAGLGVWTKVVIPKRVLFGPYLGLTTTNSSNSGYSWKIMRDKRTAHYVDARDPDKSNWMRYVNCARHEEEQNLVAFQYKGGIYYRTVCQIEKNVELLVWYGDDYGVDLGINVKAYHQSVKERRQRIRDNHKSTKEMDSQGNIQTCRYCKKEFTSVQELEEHNKKQYRWHCGGSLTNRGNKVFENTDTIGEVNSKIGNAQRKAEYVPLVERLYILSCSGKMDTKSRANDLRRVRIRRPDYTPNSLDEEVRARITYIAANNKGINLPLSTNRKVLTDFEGECVDGENNEKEFDDAGKVEVNKIMPMRVLYGECFNNNENMKERPVLIWNKNGDLFKCYDCMKGFAKKIDLINHLIVHYDGIYNENKTEEIENGIAREDCRKHAVEMWTEERPFQCKLCSKKFSDNGNLKRHERVHTGERPFQCKLCSKKFSDNGNLKKHERVHTGERPFQCKLCSKKFTQFGNLKIHERVHTGERPFQCKLCSKKFTLFGNLKLHERVHTGERPFQCKLCSKKFSDNGKLKKHERVHTGERPFQCKLCSKKFSENGSLKKHERVHTGERPFQCKLCSKKFTNSGDLKRHERVHTGERPFQCKLCSKKFTRSEHLKTHERVHTGERPFQCKLCSKKFSENGSLKKHERVHTGERPFQCKLCSKKFTKSSNLKTHERVHTGERPFQCKLCSKKFTQFGNLKKHERVHTGERPFQCKLCSKKFTESHHLKSHERVHTGERPFQCKLSSKKFTQFGNLKLHERVHTGERPFQCKMCSKKFSDNGNLKKHERVHNGL